MSLPILLATTWRGYFLPGLVAGLALAAAVVGAVLTGDSGGTDPLNGFVESLSGRSSSFLVDVRFLAPLGFAFAAGMASAVNPCGFAMLPAYLGLYLGANEQAGYQTHSFQRLLRALLVGAVVTSGFVLLFGIVGVVIGAGARSVIDIIPWLGLAVGVLLTFAGSWLLWGGKLYSGLAVRAAGRIGNPAQVSVRGYFLFGLSYGMASLSCTLPIFLVVVVTTLTVSGVAAAIRQFVLYALGMGLVVMALTVGMAFFKGAAVRALQKTLRYFPPFSGGLMIAAGSYIVYYWLTIGDLGQSIRNLL